MFGKMYKKNATKSTRVHPWSKNLILHIILNLIEIKMKTNFFRWADGSRILEIVFQSHLVSVCLVRISKKKGKVICNHKSSSSTVSWGMISRSSTSCLLESKKKFNSRTRVRFLSRSFCLKIVMVLDGNFHTFPYTRRAQCKMMALILLNPNWHELRKQEKCSSLAPPRSIFYKTQWAWQGVKLTQLMSFFTSKKV